MNDHAQLVERVVDDARRLVWKISVEEARGTPVHPAGHSDCPWTLDDGGYPAEYALLAHALKALDADAASAEGDER